MTRHSPNPRAHRQNLFLFLLGFGAAVAGSSLVAHGQTGRDAALVTHLGSTANQVRFQVRFDAPGWRTETIDEKTYRYPVWPGLAPLGEPGTPLLPAKVVRIALPPVANGVDPSAGIDVGIQPREEERISGVRFPPSPQWQPVEPPRFRVPVGRTVDVRGVRQEGPAYRGPAAPRAEIQSIGIERGLRIANIAVRPIEWDPVTGEATWAREVTVTVNVSSTRPERGLPARPDRAARQAWSHGLVNPEAAAGFMGTRVDSVPPPGGIPDSWFDDGAGWLKIHIEQNGVYALSRTDLETAGVPVSVIDPRSLRLYAGPLVPEVAWAGLGWDTLSTSPLFIANGWAHVFERPGFDGGFDDPGAMQQVAIEVVGEGDGSFDGSDRVIFYALGPDNFRDRFGLPLDQNEDFLENPYTDYTVYWLTWEGSFSDSPLRMQTVNAAPGGGTVITTSTARVHQEQNGIYSPSLYQAGRRWDEWFWDILDSFSAGKQFFVDLPHLVFGSTLDAHVRLWGANIPVLIGIGDETLHHVQMDINDQDAGLYKWGGTDPDSAFSPQDAVVSGLQASAQTRFVFRVPDVPSSDPNRFDQVYLTWIDVTYQRFLIIDGVATEVTLDAGTPGRTFRVTSQPPMDFEILDVSDYRRPRRLAGISVTDTGTETIAEFSFDLAGSGVIAVYPDAAPRTPPLLVLDDPPSPRPDPGVRWLRDTTEPLDYVIITHDDFADEADALALWRRDHLYPFTPGRTARVRVVTLSDVMDEFAWGMKDPAAIRYFLEYAFRYYGSPGDDPLSYCLLAGDHTYDYRDRLGVGEPDWVASWEDNRGDLTGFNLGNVQYASDDPLARFDGVFDTITDLYLGRITVSSAVEARAVIQDKIIRSEAQPSYGAWRAKCLLVSDDLCQNGVPDPLGQSFVFETEEVDGLLPSTFDRQKLMLVDYGETCDIRVKPQAKADLIASWNAGAWLIDYTGHGNEFFIADERILEMADIAALENLDRLPLLILTASRTGKFNLPGQDGISESLVNSPIGGAVATSGSVSNQTGAALSFDLGRNYAQALFPGPGNDGTRPASAGAAFMEAKRLTGGGSDIYTFFGDPGTRPPVPTEPMSLSGPASLVRGDFASVSGTVSPGTGTRDGVVELQSEDARQFRPVGATGFLRPGNVLFRGPFPVAADTASMGFVVPASAVPGSDARIRAYAWGSDWDALGAVDPIALGGNADPTVDTEGPLLAFSAHPSEMTVGQILEATLEDPSGIKLAPLSGNPAMEVVVRDASSTEVARIDVSGDFVYDLGSHTRGTVEFPIPDLALGTYSFVLIGEDNYNNRSTVSTQVEVSSSAAAVTISAVYAYPNPFEDQTHVVFTLDQDASVHLRIYSVSGRLVFEQSMPEASRDRNGFKWDGRDRAGDLVANGVYLLQISAPGSSEGDPVRHIERLVVLR